MKRRAFLMSAALAGAATVARMANSSNSAPDSAKPGMEAEQLNPIRRRFVRVQGRGVHYLRAGEGPPVVLLHAAMSSARSMLPLMERLASDHTVFAFDHPGYGDSDPLAQRELTMADAADALYATLMALKMPPCPVFGSHTGGAMALELARRHPERVAALIVDGPCMFRPQEAQFYRSDDYMPPFVVRGDGSHLFAAWVATRDSAMWFPWNTRTASKRTNRPLPSPAGLHGAFVERLRAGDGYRALYASAFIDGREAVVALTVPATFMARADDPLFPHLDRLPELKRGQLIGRYPAEGVDYADETTRVLRGYRVEAKAPVEAAFVPAPGAINRRYVDLPGGQILVRSSGEAREGRPLLLLHEGRASSRVFEPLMRVLAQHRPVYAPDLPGNGASDPLAAPDPGIDDYAKAVVEAVAALTIGPCDIYAVGAGAAVALELMARPAFVEARVVLEAPDFYVPSFAQRLQGEWAPPLAPQWDGAHLNRLWLMLRDEYAFWPWFDTSAAAACAVDAPTEWQELHARVTDIVRSLPTYHRLTEVALRYEWEAPLRAAGKKQAVVLTVSANDPRQPHTQAAAQSAQLPDLAILPTAPQDKADALLRLLRSTEKL